MAHFRNFRKPGPFSCGGTLADFKPEQARDHFAEEFEQGRDEAQRQRSS